MLNADRDNKVKEILDFFAENNSNLKVEQVKKISALAMAYADLNNEFTDKLSHRNMQIKELKKNNFSLEELKQLDDWWKGNYSGSKALHDKIIKLINNR